MTETDHVQLSKGLWFKALVKFKALICELEGAAAQEGGCTKAKVAFSKTVSQPKLLSLGQKEREKGSLMFPHTEKIEWTE